MIADILTTKSVFANTFVIFTRNFYFVFILMMKNKFQIIFQLNNK